MTRLNRETVLHDIVIIRWTDPGYTLVKDRKIPIPRGHNTVGHLVEITDDHITLCADRLVYSDGIMDDRGQTRIKRQHIHDMTVLKEVEPRMGREDALHHLLLLAERS